MLKQLFFITALITSIAGSTKAQTTILVHSDGAGDHNILSAVALNAAVGLRTITLVLGAMPAGGKGTGYDKTRVLIFATQDAYSAVTGIMSCSLDGTNFASLVSRKITDGASEVDVVTDTITTGADADFMLEFDTRGCASVKVIVGGTGAGASDLVDVQAVSIGGR